MSRTTMLIAVLVLIYVGVYVGFRHSHAEVWERDKQTYVISRTAPAARSTTTCGGLLPISTAPSPGCAFTSGRICDRSDRRAD